MGSLQEELLKAKLISRKESKKAARETREKRKQKDVPDCISGKTESRYEDLLAQKADKDREIEEIRRKQKKTKDMADRIRNIISTKIVMDHGRGSHRFYFVARDGRIPYLEISSKLADDLGTGRAAIVEMPGSRPETYIIVTRDAALKLQQEESDTIRFFNATEH